MLPAYALLVSCSLTLGASFRRTLEKKQYRIQSGPCSYTFLLPETDTCPPASELPQEDQPAQGEDSMQRLEQLETIMENNTQWLHKLETYIQDSMKQEMVQIQQTAVHNHTAAMIEFGTNLLSQTRKLTSVEAKVINQTTRLELQLLENSLSTNKLEKQILLQTNEINKLNDKNNFLERRVEEMEGQRQEELKALRGQEEQLQQLVQQQAGVMEELVQELRHATSNNSALQRQQEELLRTVNGLVAVIAIPPKASAMTQEASALYKDCAALYKAGKTKSGVYTLAAGNSTQRIKVYCDMETAGGGWTVLQKRSDGRVDFHRTWNEYKTGFGDPAGEYWLGNDFIFQLTNPNPYVLRIQLMDWEGNSAFSQYDQFALNSEAQKYRIHLKGYAGTAGKTSSFGQPGSDFSTKDADNDKCVCKCSQLTTGGWWFDACGPSNLNGIYYQLGQNTNRFNGIKWYYWKGSGYSLKATSMMIRPVDF
ncbi:angiopoietin-2a [Paramormyrops kingsleyae]|uniref:angiopoietin-2a n=1 Tax=Paramormyrops kingsleyae TaxID=1676925 RepID=UPI003B96AB2D